GMMHTRVRMIISNFLILIHYNIMPPKAEEEMLINENFKMKEQYLTFKLVEVPLPYCVDHEKMILKPATNPL
ncbi:3556_t:CDS:2, partial [Dentiscutata erythropus]